MPGDTNFHGTLFGGKLAAWLDVTAAICAQRHCGEPVVTASIDKIDFITPVWTGNVVELQAIPTYVGHRSIEVTVSAYREVDGDSELVAKAHLTFVTHSKKPIFYGLDASIPEDAEMIEEGHKRYLLRKAQRAN